jgi:hypothetical protein
MAPIIHSLGRRRREVKFTYRPHCPIGKCLQYPLNRSLVGPRVNLDNFESKSNYDSSVIQPIAYSLNWLRCAKVASCLCPYLNTRHNDLDGNIATCHAILTWVIDGRERPGSRSGYLSLRKQLSVPIGYETWWDTQRFWNR